MYNNQCSQKCKQFANAYKMQKQITCNLNKSRLKQPNAGGVCYDTHFRTYIITHDRGQREAASISFFHLFINGIVRAHDRRKSTEQD